METANNYNQKINIGLRVYPEVKKDLLEKANAAGVTLSEFVESMILNYHDLAQRNKISKEQNSKLKEDLHKKEQIIEDYKMFGKNVGTDLQSSKAEIDSLKNEVTELKKVLLEKEEAILTLNQELLRKSEMTSEGSGNDLKIDSTFANEKDFFETLLYNI